MGSAPAARWAGGPVSAGGSYQINELGQESFLSNGSLSLIDRASAHFGVPVISSNLALAREGLKRFGLTPVLYDRH